MAHSILITVKRKYKMIQIVDFIDVFIGWRICRSVWIYKSIFVSSVALWCVVWVQIPSCLETKWFEENEAIDVIFSFFLSLSLFVCAFCFFEKDPLYGFFIFWNHYPLKSFFHVFLFCLMFKHEGINLGLKDSLLICWI